MAVSPWKWASLGKWLASDSVFPDSFFLVIPLFYLCIWFPAGYLFHFILQQGYSFLSIIEFERSAIVPCIGEMWLVVGINHLNYRKTLIAAWWNYRWVVDIRLNTKLSIFALFRRMSAMLEFPFYWCFLWYLCVYCSVLSLSLVNMILFDMRYVGCFRNVRHIWLAAILVRRHLECRSYLIPGSKIIWNYLDFSGCEITKLDSMFNSDYCIICVISDTYKK